MLEKNKGKMRTSGKNTREKLYTVQRERENWENAHERKITMGQGGGRVGMPPGVEKMTAASMPAVLKLRNKLSVTTGK